MPLNEFAPSESIAIDDLCPSPFQTRKIDDEDADIGELACSIREMGVLHPIVTRVNQTGPTPYEIVAGERRWRAARMAGREFIQATIHQLSDQEAREIVAVENLHRKDLHYLEEAAAIKSLIDGGWTLLKIADHFGKSPGWIARRANLVNLTEQWRQAIATGEHAAARWPAGCLELIARLTTEQQDEAFEECFNFDDATVESVEQYCAQYTHLLSAAGWSLDDPLVVPLAGACSRCPKRSSHQPGLFDELDEPDEAKRSAKDRCLDTVCWNKKQAAVVAAREANLRAKHKDLVLIHRAMDTRPDGVESQPDYQFKEVKKTAEGAKPAMLVTGPNTGKQIWVQPLRSSIGSAVGSARDKPKREKDPETGKPVPRPVEERRTELLNRRRVHTVKLVAEYVCAVEATKFPNRDDLVYLAIVFGTQNRRDAQYDRFYKQGADAIADDPEYGVAGNAWSRFMELTTANEKASEADNRLWRAIRPVVLRRLNPIGPDKNYPPEKLLIEATQLLAVVDPDMKVETFYQQAVAAIPMAKSWSDMTDPDAEPAPAAEPTAKGKRKSKAKATVKAAGDVPF